MDYYSKCRSDTTSTVVTCAPLARASHVKWRYIKYLALTFNYLCANSLAILVSAVLVLTCGQTDRQRRMIAILTRLPPGLVYFNYYRRAVTFFYSNKPRSHS